MVLTVCIGHQFSMSAVPDHSAFVEYCNLITELAAGQAVGNIDCGLITSDVGEVGVDSSFCNRIDVVAILGNLMDNAIAAAAKSKDKKFLWKQPKETDTVLPQ